MTVIVKMTILQLELGLPVIQVSSFFAKSRGITIIANVQFVSEARGFLKGLKTLRKRRYVFKPSAGNIKILKRLYNFEF